MGEQWHSSFERSVSFEDIKKHEEEEMTDEKMPDEVGIDNDYPDTGDNRFSLKIKEHRTRYIRAATAKPEVVTAKRFTDLLMLDTSIRVEDIFSLSDAIVKRYPNGVKVEGE